MNFGFWEFIGVVIILGVIFEGVSMCIKSWKGGNDE